jgi:DNA repair ATPase RecN
LSVLLHVDGSPLPTTTPTHRQKLLQATQKYKKAVENAEKRQKLIRAKLSETKAQSQKQQALVKQAQRAVVVAFYLFGPHCTLSLVW